MDYKKVVQECFIFLRKHMSREKVANSLGVSSSSVYKWENGVTQPEWRHLVQYLKLQRIEIPQNLKSQWNGVDLENGIEVVRFYAQEYGLKEVAEICELSRNGLVKMLESENSPKVSIVFSLLGHYSEVSLLVFLEGTVSLSNLSSLSKLGQRWQLELELSTEFPFIGGVIYGVAQGVPKEEAARRFSRYFSTKPETIQKLLDLLVSFEIIHVDQDEYSIKNRMTFDSRCNVAINRELRSYWIKTALRALESKNLPQSRFNYVLLDTSYEAYKQIEIEYQKFNQQVRQILTNDRAPKDSFYLLNTQLIDFTDFETQALSD
ncbi:MAG: DUF4423 domain-containing protein [Pseudomonadota bacterium]